MTQLKSNITLEELSCLITDVASGGASDWTYLNSPDKAYVSVHEAIVYEDKELIKFSAELSAFLTGVFGKNVPTSRYSNGNDAGYSIFSSLFTSQGGLVRILWLNGKILSILIGAKPKKITCKDKKSLTYSASYFGLSKGSDADISLSDEDKDALMALHPTTWPVSDEKTSVGQRNDDYGRSFSVSKNYVRHGSIEKFIGSDSLNFLVYPKSDNNLFNKGGSNGSGLPGLVNMVSKFDYNDMLESNLLSGEWSKYRDYDNTVFMSSKDLTPYLEDKSYMKFSFDSLTKFQASKEAVKKKDIITRKHSVLTDVDIKKYFDNPKYHVVFSEDKLMYYICKSDKLKATALQTKITKSMREDFISFLNWIGYFSLAADLDPASMGGDYFRPLTLFSAKKITWTSKGLSNLVERKDKLVTAASNLYRTLYMGETDAGSCKMLSSVNDLFKLIYQDCGSGSSFYHALHTDPVKILYFGGSTAPLVSFNKKFALDVSLLNVMRTFCNEKEEPSGDYIGCNRLSDVIPFLNTNFLLSNTVENAYEMRIKEYADNSVNRRSVPYWYLSNEVTNEEQLLKTCITLSPETLAIFGSVASLASPTDILSWLELSKEHFVTELPKRLVKKFGANIGDEKTISEIIENGITFYSLILSAAEPFSNKLLSPDSTDDETGD